MRVSLLVALLVLSPLSAVAKTLNVELKFTPYVGDAATNDHVETVPGLATLVVNGVPYGEQPIGRESVQVVGAERDIAPALWLSVETLGPVVRKGKNRLRIEFVPTDSTVDYRASFAWAAVTDEETRADAGGKATATNTQGAGKDEKAEKGRIVFEREIIADFAPDVAWHHYPPVQTIGAADEKNLTALVMERAAAFTPDFAGVYRALADTERIDVAKVKEAKCVEAAYAAGVRVDAPKAAELAFVTTGNPEVVVRRKRGLLFAPADPSAFRKIEGQEMQMCAGIALSVAFPPKLVVVRAPDGAWRIVY